MDGAEPRGNINTGLRSRGLNPIARALLTLWSRGHGNGRDRKFSDGSVGVCGDEIGKTNAPRERGDPTSGLLKRL